MAHIGKEGWVCLINRDSMGQVEKDDCSGSNTQIAQIFAGAGGMWGAPAVLAERLVLRRVRQSTHDVFL